MKLLKFDMGSLLASIAKGGSSLPSTDNVLIKIVVELAKKPH